MLDVSVLPAFLAVILAFLAPPGPDMTYMVAVGLQGGRAAAIRAIVGIGAGMSVYAAAVALGLGAVAAAYPAALTGVKLAGATYLLWLAVSTFRTARTIAAGTAHVGSQRWFLRGAMVSLTNPKLILFFLAFLPRFLGQAQDTTAQLAMLGAVNVTTEVALYGAVGVGASTFRNRFISRPGAQQALHRLAAAVYLALALLIIGEAAGAHLG
ncbi:LysE family translocator [Arsenicicoccus dermatophilus]|uniref:LysE family translocator n=1 Tax=Arsenicicoccus dermatophilus TaxID=1076331 RepID=UPI003916E3D3